MHPKDADGIANSEDPDQSYPDQTPPQCDLLSPVGLKLPIEHTVTTLIRLGGIFTSERAVNIPIDEPFTSRLRNLLLA